ncbi:Zinc knuckle CX2CX4HX4C protein [Raphanus sativus]|nr:Zinc knuckle CX2CX4HX4C protein [Raphanus sativus]
MDDFRLANKSGANFRKVYFLAGKEINSKNFQNLFGNLQRSYGNNNIFLKSSSKYGVYLGFFLTPPSSTALLWISLCFTYHSRDLFLLLMDESLAGVMQGMSLEDDVPIVLPEDDDFSAVERNSHSLLAGAIGYVKEIEWDPEKPLLQNYVRVQVVLDLNLPVREKKSLTLPKGGGTAMIDVEYERIRKKCFHCFRLSHEKQVCPVLKGTRTGNGK